MDAIRRKVPFYKIFSQRRYQLYFEETDRVFAESELGDILFRDSGLKSGSKIILREPQRAPRQPEEEEEEVAEESSAEEGEAEHLAGEGWEGGEDEMIEMEGGEDELSEKPEEEAKE